MKKTKGILSVVAFVLAVGGAFATALNPPVQGYVFNGISCQESTFECSGIGPECKDMQNRLVGNSALWNGTSCGSPLRHQ
ncbi:MAG TPA: DUF6520 family protein [Chryseosolibacter sp.]